MEDLIINENGNVYCTNQDIEEIAIPKEISGIKVEGITNYAFAWRTSLTRVIISGSVEYIGDSAFEGCGLLESLSLHKGVEYIGSYAFSSCSSLTSVTIPDSVKFIDDCAFVNCTSLKEISISKNTKLGKNVFLRCPKDLKITWR